jgi:hypothetical protein
MPTTTWLPLVVAFALHGCGGEDGPVPVEGVVRLNGAPVAGATVSFLPEGGGRPAVGATNRDGRFRLTTFESGDGALPGRYRVVVTKVEPVELPPFDAQGEEDGERLTERFEEYQRSRRASRRTLLPAVYGRADTTPLSHEVKPDETPVVLDLSATGPK